MLQVWTPGAEVAMAGGGSVPITMGSPRSRALAVEHFTIFEAWFPPDQILPRHTHERASFVVMLDGCFDLRLRGASHHCAPATVFTEPAGSPHANRMGRTGAHVIVVQPDEPLGQWLRPVDRIFAQPVRRHDALMAQRGSRLSRELELVDDLTPLAAESVVLEMLAHVARLERIRTRPPPPWLWRAQAMLHDRFAEPLRIGEVAREAEVHPAHLARVFRTTFGISVGSYVRRLRLDWAAKELVRPGASLAAVAAAAGFADQSHFTRAFRRGLGVTPDAYRRSMRH